MKIIYLLLLLGFISCSTNPGVVIDLWYNYEYSLLDDLTKYSDYSFYAFRIPVNYEGKMDFEVKVPKNTYQEFEIYVHDWKWKPEIGDIVQMHGSSKTVTGSGKYKEGDYYVYSYSFEAGLGATYFSIEMIKPNYSFSYIIVRVNSAKYRYSKIKELSFNTDYKIDTSIFTASQYKIPFNYQIYIRISVFSDDQMEIQLTTHKAYDKNTAFKVDVCQYVDKPTEEQVYYGNNAAKTNTQLENKSEEGGKYYYPFKTDSGINYLSISIINQLRDLDYLFIYIYSETGMAAALIALIVILPILVVGGIVYFILRKLGFCRESNEATKI